MNLSLKHHAQSLLQKFETSSFELTLSEWMKIFENSASSFGHLRVLVSLHDSDGKSNLLSGCGMNKYRQHLDTIHAMSSRVLASPPEKSQLKVHTSIAIFHFLEFLWKSRLFVAINFQQNQAPEISILCWKFVCETFDFHSKIYRKTLTKTLIVNIRMFFDMKQF